MSYFRGFYRILCNLHAKIQKNIDICKFLQKKSRFCAFNLQMCKKSCIFVCQNANYKTTNTMIEQLSSFFGTFDLKQIVAATFFLIAIIDPLGNMPLTISMEKQGAKINAWIVCLASAIILIAFLLLGDSLMSVFGIKVEYFAIAGGFIIFLMALEMILDITIFKADVDGNGNIVPLAFPMYAGPGAFTALIAMTAEYSVANLIAAVLVCIVILFLVLIGTHWLMKYLGKNSLYIIRKFFGIIVLAIACQLMFGNLAAVF